MEHSPRASVFIFVFSQVEIFRRASRAQKTPQNFRSFLSVFGLFRIFSKFEILFSEKMSKILFFLRKNKKLWENPRY